MNLLSRALLTTAMITASTGVALGTAAAAHADPSPVPSQKASAGTPAKNKVRLFFLRNEATNRCLDDSTRYGLRPFVCNNTSFQQWEAIPQAGTSAYAWKNSNTWRCIDDSFEYGLRSHGCNGGVWQHWYLGNAGGNKRWFQNNATRGCIDDSFEYGLRSFGCNGGVWQNFKFEE